MGTSWHGEFPTTAGAATIRAERRLWTDVVSEIFDFGVRERAGVLFVRSRRSAQGHVLVATDWMPVPDEYVLSSEHGLVFDGRFNLRAAEHAAAHGYGTVLVHAHPGHGAPLPSRADSTNGRGFVGFMRRRLPTESAGLLIVSDDTITGIIDTGENIATVDRVTVAGIPARVLRSTPPAEPSSTEDDRQLLAIGTAGQAALENATVAVIGNSGGGSHVTQQLIHAGVGILIVVDDDVVTVTNLRRLVTARQADIDTTDKVDLARRTTEAVRPAVAVHTYKEKFPSTATIAALLDADVIIGCVDGWDTRDDLNIFALTSRIPYVDIGIAVTGAGADTTQRMRVGGQITIVTPDGPCLRCIGLVTDDRVAAARQRRLGYTDNDTSEPQVVSLNGTVASEAVTATLMLLAGDDRLLPYRRYSYPPGTLTVVDVNKTADCPTCHAAGVAVAISPTSSGRP